MLFTKHIQLIKYFHHSRKLAFKNAKFKLNWHIYLHKQLK